MQHINNTVDIQNLTDIAQLFQEVQEEESVNFHSINGSNAACLVHFLGINRLAHICRRSDVQLDFDGNTPLCKRDLRKIFINMLDIHAEDVLGLSSDEYYLFARREELEALFLGELPAVEEFMVDKAQTSGKGLQGLAERVFIQSIHHLKIAPHRDQTLMQLRDAEMLTSRLADREIQEGSLIHLSDGYFEVKKTFVEGGAYISVLKSLDPEGKTKIVCRGTALRSSATGGTLSAINDLLIEMGTLGIKKNWPALSSYLEDEGVQEVEIFGKSLGGAHAQELALLIAGCSQTRVVGLTTYGSVGVSPEINTLFNRTCAAQGHNINISVLRNGAEKEENIDHVPCIGGVHLGLNTPNANVKVFYLQTEQDSAIYSTSLGILATLGAFIRSFGTPHCRQTTLKRFSYHLIEGDEAHDHLRMGLRLEWIRKILAYTVHIFTLGLLNGESFNSYFNKFAR